MFCKRQFIKAPVALFLGLTALLSACAYDAYYPGPYSSPPAAHHPVHYYDYHYYPGAGVYFHLYSGYYYYRSGGAWVRFSILPPLIHIDSRDRIQLRIWSDKPYTHYRTHSERYHPYPGYHPDRDRDRYERKYNRSHHERYLRLYRR